MEEVEMFLAPLTARSKVREVLRGLVATRQVHSLALGHAPHFYVAGTLPEFAAAPTVYASSSMPASSHFLRSYEHEESLREPVEHRPAPSRPAPNLPAPQFASAPPQPKPAEPQIERPAQPRENVQASRPRFSHQPARARNRKPAQSSSAGRVARRSGSDARTASSRTNSSSRHAHTSRLTKSASKNGHAPRSAKSATNGNRFRSNGHSRPANGSSGLHKAKPAAARNLRNGHASNGKPAAKSASRRVDASRKSARPAARGSRKPALAASTKAGNRSRYGFTASSNRRSKKRG
jgi:hypothetical protein